MNNKIEDIRARRLIISNILFRAGTIISQIFLNIFLFKNTNDLQLIAVFNIVLLSTHLFSFSYFGKIVKYGYRNLTHITSMLGLSVTYLILLIVGVDIIDYQIILAIFLGFFSGIYWIGYNNSEFELTNKSNRGNFQGLKKSLKIFISIFVPILIGSIIGLNFMGYGYESAFFVGILFFFSSAIVGKINIEYSVIHKYSILNAIKKIYLNKEILKNLGNFSLLGFSLSNPLLNTILPVLLFSYGINEIELGFLISSFSVLTLILSYVFGKFVGYEKYKISYIISCLLYIIAVIVLLFFPSYWYIVLFSSILNLLFTFIDIPQNVFSSNLFHDIDGYKDIKGEYMVIREWPLMIGRISAFILIYFIGSFDENGVKTLFLIMAFFILLSTFLFNSIKINHN